MAAGSAVTLEVDAAAVPVFEGVLPLVNANRSGGLASNKAHFAPGVQVETGLPASVLDLLFDPQTSGGLLAGISEADAPEAGERLARSGVQARQVGRVVEPTGRAVVVR